jgi:hypothetical protein
MLRAPVIKWLAIACLTLLPMASQAQVVEQYYGVKRVNIPVEAPKAAAEETATAKPEAPAPAKKVDPSEPTPIATATPLQPIDYRPAQREFTPQWMPLLTPTDPYKALAAPNPAPAEEKPVREPAEPVKALRANTPTVSVAQVEPRDIWEWIVVLGKDAQALSVGLGSAATMLALVAIMRPRPMQSAPIVNVTMPTTSTTMQSPGPMMGWSYQEPRRKKRKKKSAPAEAEYVPREPNFTMGPTFEEEQAEMQLMAQQAGDAMLNGLVDANVAMRGAMAQAAEETTPTTSPIVS